MQTRVENRTRILFAILLLCSALMFASCAANQTIATQAKSQSTAMLDTYHAAFIDVRDTLNNPLSTPAQRSLALQKRAILVKIWDVLGPYEKLINDGGSPGVDDTQTINALIDQLAKLATSTVNH
jgi:hypothetical protein